LTDSKNEPENYEHTEEFLAPIAKVLLDEKRENEKETTTPHDSSAGNIKKESIPASTVSGASASKGEECVRKGNQPEGTMHSLVKSVDLDGYPGCGTISITYIFSAGIQQVGYLLSVCNSPVFIKSIEFLLFHGCLSLNIQPTTSISMHLIYFEIVERLLLQRAQIEIKNQNVHFYSTN